MISNAIQIVLLDGTAQVVFNNVVDTVNTVSRVITCPVCVTMAVVMNGKERFVKSKKVLL